MQDNAVMRCRGCLNVVFTCLLQGVQLLLDGVVEYLPNPLEVNNHALDQNKNEEKVFSNSFICNNDVLGVPAILDSNSFVY